jgi:hypothetical protein
MKLTVHITTDKVLWESCKLCFEEVKPHHSVNNVLVYIRQLVLHPEGCCVIKHCHFFFFFFQWRYSPMWALACRTITLHLFLSIASSLHLLTPSSNWCCKVSHKQIKSAFPEEGVCTSLSVTVVSSYLIAMSEPWRPQNETMLFSCLSTDLENIRGSGDKSPMNFNYSD